MASRLCGFVRIEVSLGSFVAGRSYEIRGFKFTLQKLDGPFPVVELCGLKQ